MATSPFRNDNNLIWYIDDTINTLTNSSRICPYDRMVGTGNFDNLFLAVKVWDYSIELSSTVLRLVSTNFPIYISLSLPPKSNLIFYIELAVIGGSIAAFILLCALLMFGMSIILKKPKK